MARRAYAGKSTRTRTEAIVYACPCGERFRASVHRAVDTGDAALAADLREGRLNRVRCPSCEGTWEVAVPVLYHDLEGGRLVLVLPEALRHRELEERAALFAQLAEDREPPPLYALQPDVVFGAAGLRAALAPAPAAADFPATPASVTPPPADPPAPTPAPAAAAVAPQPLLDGERTDRIVTPSDDATQVKLVVPDPRSAVVERWIAGREGAGAYLVDEQVLLLAALPPPALEAFLGGGDPSLRVQLHRMPTYPVVSLTLIAGGTDESRRDEHRVIVVPLDVARAAHRVVLEALDRRCAVRFEMYDAEYLPVASFDVAAPLEENVRRLVPDAREALERIAPPTRSIERALGLMRQPSYDLLGRTPVELPGEGDSLERPASVLAALSQVIRWSEPSAEAYLVEIRSYPLTRWRALRARVVSRALDVGLFAPRGLIERVARDLPSPPGSWQELLGQMARRFSDVSARRRPNDLSAVEESENWEQLLRECAQAGVVLEERARDLAGAAQKRARASRGGGVDLRTFTTEQLLALLEQKDLRREAAIILCERRESPTLPALFGAVRTMTRGEANLVLPAVSAFGPAAERWLIEGLRAKKAYMRQGCALGLGVLKTPLGVDALVRLLLVEPTEIWSEVARALGDCGPAALLPLMARLREVDADGELEDGERRGRIVRALGHIAAKGARPAVEALAGGKDRLVAAAARQGLALCAELEAENEALARADVEQTVVRGFSRRFYEALDAGAGAVELDPGDLEEIGEAEEEPPRRTARAAEAAETTDPGPTSTLSDDDATRVAPAPTGPTTGPTKSGAAAPGGRRQNPRSGLPRNRA